MRSLFSSMRLPLAVVLLLVMHSTFCAGQGQSPDAVSAAQMKELKKYPLNDFGEVFSRMQKEVAFPAPRSESKLLPLLPQTTVFYAAFPNYGATAQQALKIFRQERQTRPALLKWWQSGDMAKNGPKLDMAIERFGELSQYLGDEVVVSGAMNGSNAPSVVLLAEVRKPGLKLALEQAIQQLAEPGKPGIRVLDKQSLASATEGTPREMMVLVRPDYVIAASNLETLRSFNRQLDQGTHDFAANPFGQRLKTSYSGGLTTLAGADLEKVLQGASLPAQQGMALQVTGFSDVKYALWEHKEIAGKTSSESELSFTRPRRGVVSWLAAPRDLGSLEFASPKALLVASVALKNLGEVFDDIQKLAGAANPNSMAQLDAMQQGLGIRLKEDLLSQLSGEITLEVDEVAAAQPVWKAILQVNDTARVQQTFAKLLASAPVSHRQSEEGGITYHSLVVPSPNKSMEIGYAFVDGYLVIGSSGEGVREAVRLHREGGSLGKSSKFLAALPAGHSKQMSALYYSDPVKLMGMQMSRFSPLLSQSMFRSTGEMAPAISCAYADETSIRGASTSPALDVGVVMAVAALAIPNLLRAKNSANEASAVGSLRNMITAQISYSTEYPARGFARDLASLGSDPNAPGSYTPKHAGLLDASLAKPECKVSTWCEKSGYKFTFAQVCPKLLCQEFVAIGTPASASAGSRNLCATSDGVVRTKPGSPLSAPISAAECRRWTPLE